MYSSQSRDTTSQWGSASASLAVTLRRMVSSLKRCTGKPQQGNHSTQACTSSAELRQTDRQITAGVAQAIMRFFICLRCGSLTDDRQTHSGSKVSERLTRAGGGSISAALRPYVHTPLTVIVLPVMQCTPRALAACILHRKRP